MKQMHDAIRHSDDSHFSQVLHDGADPIFAVDLSSIHLQAVSLPANWRTKLSLAWKPLGLNVSSLFSLVSFVRDVVTCFDASHMSALDVVVSGSLSWLVQLGFNSALLSNPL